MPLTVAKTLPPITNFVASAMALIVFITVAALAYIDTFDVSEHPLQVLYLAAYLGVGAGSALLLWQARSPAVAT